MQFTAQKNGAHDSNGLEYPPEPNQEVNAWQQCLAKSLQNASNAA